MFDENRYFFKNQITSNVVKKFTELIVFNLRIHALASVQLKSN